MMIPAPCGHVEPHVLENSGVDGVWAVEKNNWTGKALMVPDSLRKDLRARGGLDGPDMCPLLIGPTETGCPSHRA